MKSDNSLIQDNLFNSHWLGEVVDIEDPLFEGRIKVKVFGKFDEIDKNDIPWATPHNNITGGSSTGSGFHSVPKLGSIVGVIFENGNLFEPEWYKIQHISNELKDEISGSYNNAHSIIYDTVTEGGLKLFFTEDKGLVFDYKESLINIKNDNTIIIKYKNGKLIHIKKDSISIGSENKSEQPAVLGDNNKDALDSLADQINNLTIALQQYTAAQIAVTSSVPIYSPLSAALTTLAASISTIPGTIGKLKSITIPQTRSASVTIDGPSIKI